MADLGSLFYSLYLKDMTDSDIDKVRKKLESMNVSMNLGIDANKIDAAIKGILAQRSYSVNIAPASMGGKGVVPIDIDKQTLRKSIEDALKGNTYEAKVKLVVDKAQVSDAIKQAFAKAGVQYNTTASDVRQQRILDIKARMAERAALAQQRLTNAQEAGARAAQRNNSSISSLNSSLTHQDRILSGLKNQIANVYSIYTLERFATQLVEIGGEFQKQRIALQAILGSASKADAIYAKIKDLAIESPFNFKELMGYTKQLSAFSIPYNELYETTKRLADISSGLGVDMGRIILAYGQVRSAAFLRGQEVRQFTEAGIPLLDELAKKFSLLENRVVSVGEVFDKISQREVPFQMVKDVLWDLTNEGGKFYNMQEVLTESLSGKLAKLKDSYEIMLSEVAQANNKVLGGGLDALTSLTDHWKELLTVLSGVISAYGAYRAVVLLVNVAQKANLAINKIAAIVEVSRAIQGLTKATKAQAVAQYALNAAMSASPLYWIAAAIGILTGSLIYLSYRETAAEKAVRLHREEQERFNKTIDERKSKIDNLIRVIQDETETEYAQIKAYEELKKLSPSLTNAYTKEQLAVASLTEMNQKLNEERDNLSYEHIISEIDRVRKVMAAYQQQSGLSGIALENKEVYQSYRKELGLLNEQLDEYNRLRKEAEENAKPIEIKLIEAKSSRDQIIQEFNAAKLELEKEQEKLKNSPFSIIPIDVQIRFNNAQSALKDIDNEIVNLLSGENTTIKNKSYWENIKKDAEDARNALDSSLIGSDRWNKLTETIKNAQKEIDKFSDKENGKDYTAELWKKRIDLIDKALSSYKEWSKLEGENGASNRVKNNKEFSDLFTGAYGFKLDLENPDKAWEYIQKQLGNTEKQKDLSLSIGVKLDKNEQENLKKEIDKSLKDIQKYIDETTKKWDLYKTLFEATGDKAYSMKVAFSDSVHWDSVALEMRKKLEESMKYAGISVNIDFTETEEEAKNIFGGENSALYKLWEETKKRIEKNGIDLKVNAANAIKEVQSISDKIKSIENQRDADLANYAEGTPEYDAILKKWNNEILELKNSLLEASPAFQKLFIDTTGMSINQIGNLRKEAQKLIDLVNATKSPVLDSNGTVKGYKYTGSDGKESYISKENYDEIIKRSEKLGKKAGQVQIAFKRMWDWINGKEQGDGTKLTFKDIAGDLSLIAQEASNASGELGSMFDAIGKGSLGDAFSFAGDMLGSVGSIASGVASGNPFAVIGGIASGITSIVQLHDNKLNKAIERSKQRVDELKAAYDNLNDSVERFGGMGTRAVEEQLALYEQLNGQVQRSGSSLSGSYSIIYETLKNSSKYAEYLKEQLQGGQGLLRFLKIRSIGIDKEALKALEDVGVGGTDALKAYQAQYVSLVAQRKELEGQLRDEEAKKKSDSGAIADYQQQINELNVKIRYFIEDLAKELYAIDFDDWGSQISDALVNAFANGEDAAAAFDNTVNNIMKNIANSILKNMVIAPMMEKLQKKLFGDENGKGGVFGSFEDLNKNTELAASVIKDFFDTEGNAMLDASDKFLEAFDKATGGALKASGESNTSGVSKEIQGVTEDTGNLLGSYLNAIRQDVSIKRMLQEKFFNDEFPRISVIAQAQLQQLNAIATNTARNAQFAEEIRDMFNRIIDKGSGKLKGL